MVCNEHRKTKPTCMDQIKTNKEQHQQTNEQTTHINVSATTTTQT